MALPNITFNVNTDGLQRAGDPVQKIPGLIITGATIAGVDKVTIGQSYQIFTLKQAEELGIEATGDNAFAHKHLKQFFEAAGYNSELWIMLVSDATTYEDMGEVQNDIAKKLIADSKGAIRILGVVKEYTATDVIEDGLDVDVHNAVLNFEALRTFYFDKYRPFKTIISGNAYEGTPANLLDYGDAMHTSTQIFLANTDGAKEASIGLLLGRYAQISTQRHPGVPKDGPITSGLAYLTDGTEISQAEDDLEAIHTKKYTFLRSFTGRPGYFVSDDLTLSKAADNDYSSMARGLVMDEAILIAYDSMVDNLNEDIEVSGNGNIHPAIVKSWQGQIERQLESGMVDTGKIQAAQAVIDPAQDVLSNDKVAVTLRILPKGYAKYIDINIGFTTSIDN